MAKTVVVTGASGGIGRATARGALGAFDARSHEGDPQLWAAHHHGVVAGAAGAAAVLAGMLRAGRRG